MECKSRLANLGQPQQQLYAAWFHGSQENQADRGPGTRAWPGSGTAAGERVCMEGHSVGIQCESVLHLDVTGLSRRMHTQA